MRSLFVRFVWEDSGQDIVESALLAALIATVGVLLWRNIGVGISNAYLGWDSGVQNLSSCTPDPIAFGGGGC